MKRLLGSAFLLLGLLVPRSSAASGVLQASYSVNLPYICNYGALHLVLSLTNTGTNDLVNVTPSVPVALGAGGSALAGGPFPASMALNAGANGSFSWNFSYSTVSAGTMNFSGYAQGIDVITGVTETSSFAYSPAILVNPVVTFSIVSSNLSPPFIDPCTPFTWVVTVQNPSLVPVDLAEPTSVSGTSGSIPYTLSAPNPTSITVQPGATEAFTFTGWMSGTAGTLAFLTAFQGYGCGGMTYTSPSASNSIIANPACVLSGSPTPTPTPAPPSAPAPYSYPNPATGNSVQFAVEMAGGAGQATLSVWDSSGNLLSNSQSHLGGGTQSLALDVTGWANANYFFKVDISYDSGGGQSFPTALFSIVH
jgi:hypothetical protein